MTAILVLAVLLLLAVAGPLLGADSRSSKGWSASDPFDHLWSDTGRRTVH